MECTCCGEPLKSIGVQTFPAKYKLQPLELVECRCPECLMYRRTLSRESHPQECMDEMARHHQHDDWRHYTAQQNRKV
jgi:hypothetical protein